MSSKLEFRTGPHGWASAAPARQRTAGRQCRMHCHYRPGSSEEQAHGLEFRLERFGDAQNGVLQAERKLAILEGADGMAAVQRHALSGGIDIEVRGFDQVRHMHR